MYLFLSVSYCFFAYLIFPTSSLPLSPSIYISYSLFHSILLPFFYPLSLTLSLSLSLPPGLPLTLPPFPLSPPFRLSDHLLVQEVDLRKSEGAQHAFIVYIPETITSIIAAQSHLLTIFCVFAVCCALCVVCCRGEDDAEHS